MTRTLDFGRLEKQRVVIQRPKKKLDSQKIAQIETAIAERIQPINLLDILTDTELRLNWTKFFMTILSNYLLR